MRSQRIALRIVTIEHTEFVLDEVSFLSNLPFLKNIY